MPQPIQKRRSRSASLYLAALACALVASTATASIASLMPNQILGSGVADGVSGNAPTMKGDFNKDGFDDLVVGAPHHANGQDREGAVRIYYGSATSGFPAQPNLYYESDQVFGGVGAANAVADVNGDGFDDLLTGGENYSVTVRYAGAVLLFLGSAQGLPSTPSQIISGTQSNGAFGLRIVPFGDNNADGYDDVLVSGVSEDDSKGAVYLYQGGPAGLSTTPAAKIVGERSGALFGLNVAVGDSNNDGLMDAMITKTGSTTVLGKIGVYVGTTQGINPEPLSHLEPLLGHTSDSFGGAITSGDWNADGYADVAVGSRRYNTGRGLVTIYFGIQPGLIGGGPATTLEDADVGAYFSSITLKTADLNGDGKDDLVVGRVPIGTEATEFNYPTNGDIRVYTSNSQFGFSNSPIYTFAGLEANDQLGSILAADGDIDGDGKTDLVATTVEDSVTATREGVIRLYLAADTVIAPPVTSPTTLSVISAFHRPLTHLALAWQGGTENVAILRNGVAWRTVSNRGRYTARLLPNSPRTTATVTYQVCNVDTTQCSAVVSTQEQT